MAFVRAKDVETHRGLMEAFRLNQLQAEKASKDLGKEADEHGRS